ncbi:hypothetical protein HNQ71_006168 [Mesorhizobium sangaii]|uniref:Uncharacterized protein n=1 Tax=Mesorhizobium sangaii TaxID=505389 RepID=A0A841PDR6_9HYPH|nr:hypothetical protein [Mesorhizobium sangaii]
MIRNGHSWPAFLETVARSNRLSCCIYADAKML